MADTGSATIDVAATPDRIMEVVTDIESYPDWMSAFKEASVIETDDEGRPKRAKFEVDARIKVVNYTLEYTYTDNSIAWKSVEGNVKQIEGSYSFEANGDETKVTYEYAIDPGFAVPGFLRKQGVKMMVSGALNDLKKRAESA